MPKEDVDIFESPDGGETVYKRKSGETDREQIKDENEYKGGHLG